MQKYVPYLPHLQVLVYQCGKGDLLYYLESRIGTAWGIHSSLHDLSFISSPKHVATATGKALPFANQSFDAVLVQDALPEIDRLDLVLPQLARVLRPGGRLALWMPHPLFRPANLHTLIDLLQTAGLLFVCQERYDYLAHPISAFFVKIPALGYSYAAMMLLKATFALDHLLGRIPLFKGKGQSMIIVAQKPGQSESLY